MLIQCFSHTSALVYALGDCHVFGVDNTCNWKEECNV